MESDLWGQISQTSTFLDQIHGSLEIDQEEIPRFYLPLAGEILKRREPTRRWIVAVAGPPGSGKTVFAMILTLVINTLARQELAVPIGLDGWHFPNAYLDQHTVQWQTETVPLRKLKGSPETFDQESIRAFLQKITHLERLPFPVYSRRLHDPLPDAGALLPGHLIPVLEGNYWLLAESPWTEFQDIFDFCIFLRAEPDTLIPGLRERHLRGGKSPALVEEHLHQVDLPNIHRVLSHSRPADIIVHKLDHRRIGRLEFIST